MVVDKRAHDYNDDGSEIDLREPAKEWLEGLSEQDVDDLKESVALYRSIKTVSRFVKWLIIAIIACFVAAAQLGESIHKLFVLWFAGKHP